MNKINALRTAVLSAVAMVPVLAHAAVDVSAITGSAEDVGIVAAAVFGIYVAIKAAKFVRRAL